MTIFSFQAFEQCNTGNDIYMWNLFEEMRRAFNIGDKFLPTQVLPLFPRLYGQKFFPNESDARYKKVSDEWGEYVILSGPWLAKNSFNILNSIVKSICQSGRKYMFFSAGSYAYDDQERALFSKMFEKYPPFAFSSRDHETYNAYCDFSSHSYDGVCTSLFSPFNFPIYEASTIKKSKPYVCIGLDSVKLSNQKIEQFLERANVSEKIKVLEAQSRLIRPIVTPFAIGTILKFKARKKGTLVSSSFYSYLSYYARTKVCVTTRVHVAAPCLAYGGSSFLLGKPSRSVLFKRLGLEPNDVHSPMSIDLSKLSLEREKFHDFLKGVRFAVSHA